MLRVAGGVVAAYAAGWLLLTGLIDLNEERLTRLYWDNCRKARH